MEKEKRREGMWLGRLGIAFGRILGLIPFLFDGKFLLFVIVHSFLSCVMNGYASKWSKIRSKEHPERVAVLLDGTSEKGENLKKKLVHLGYYVVFPDKKNTKSERTLGIKGDMSREESVEAFLKKLQKEQKKVDLLVLNLQRCEMYRKMPHHVDGEEKKIVPSAKKKGFITKKGEYRDKHRSLFEKDPNVRKNYLVHFLIIRGLAPILKQGQGRVVIGVDRSFSLLPKDKPPVVPSFFFSFAYSQACSILLGIGSKTRFSYLDIRVVCTSLSLYEIFSFRLFQNRIFSYFTLHTDILTAEILNAALSPNPENKVLYFNGLFPQNLEEYTEGADRANDLWEQAEMLS